jgi:hypothetical protein
MTFVKVDLTPLYTSLYQNLTILGRMMVEKEKEKKKKKTPRTTPK